MTLYSRNGTYSKKLPSPQNGNNDFLTLFWRVSTIIHPPGEPNAQPTVTWIHTVTHALTLWSQGTLGQTLALAFTSCEATD